ncbi:MAG: glycosyltransferase, partial [Candidatus Omnitrophota bacterium]
QRLKRRKKRFQKKVVILGFAENVDALMEIATFMISKPGGISSSEALAKKLPMVLLDPIRGQESANANFLIEKGTAVKARDEQEVALLVRELLMQPAKAQEMRRCSLQHQKATSALEIAHFLLTLT